MASELQTDYTTGKTIYFLLRNSVGAIWNGVSFVAYATVNLADYDILATEQGTASGYYAANMPVAAAGVYYAVAKERAGGAPAEADLTVGTGVIQWDGTAVQSLFGIPDVLLKRDIDQVEASAAIHSLASAVLKLVSKFDAKLGLTYRTDGTTTHMTQAVTTDSTMTAIRSLGSGT